MRINLNFLYKVTFLLLIMGIVFWPSTNLALFGDDWLTIFRYLQNLGPDSVYKWNHVNYFLTSYGPQDVLMGLLYRLYGLQHSTYYYFTSFVLRVAAAMSFYPLIIKLTNSKTASYFSVLFFAVMAAGLDTTNWVFNMPSYLSIFLFNFFLLFFIKSNETLSKKDLALSLIFFYLSFIAQPIRMHGSLPFTISVILLFLFTHLTIPAFKRALLQIVIFLALFLFIFFTGLKNSPVVTGALIIPEGFKEISRLIISGKTDFLFYPVTILGNVILPDALTAHIPVITSTGSFLFYIAIPILLPFLIMIYFIGRNLNCAPPYNYKLPIVLSIIWSIITFILYRTGFFSSNTQVLVSTIIGGCTLIFWLLIIRGQDNQRARVLLIIPLLWTLMSYFIAWWEFPTSFYSTTHRYLIMPGVGFTLFLGILISITKSTRQKVTIFILSILLLINAFTTNQFLHQQTLTHGKDISERIWSSIPNFPEVGTNQKPLIFYFEGDGTNGGILHDVITFGFPPHMALIYHLKEEDHNIPIPISDKKELREIIKTGKPLPAYSYPAKPVISANIYAFHLNGKRDLINITGLVKATLDSAH